MPKKAPTSGGKPTKGSRSRSSSGSRSGSSGRSRSGSRGRAEVAAGGRPLTLAKRRRVVKAEPSVTNKNYHEQQYYARAEAVRSPGGTRYANYTAEDVNSTGLPKYPSSSNSENSENSNLGTPNSAELAAAGAGYAARLPPGVQLARSTSERGRMRRRTRRRRRPSKSGSNNSGSNNSGSNSSGRKTD